jgi:hypothetical protein
MTPIQNLDSSDVFAVDVADEGVGFSVPAHELTQTDDVPQGVIDLLQQLMPQQAKLSMSLSPGMTGAVKRAAPGLKSSSAQRTEQNETLRSAGTASDTALSATTGLTATMRSQVDAALAASSFGAGHPSGIVANDAVKLDSMAGTATEGGGSRVSESNENTGQRPEWLELRLAGGGRPGVTHQVDTPVLRHTATHGGTHAELPGLGRGDDYLSLPFNRNGLNGVVTVSRPLGEVSAPLQLSTAQPEIAAHLMRQLEHAPQVLWAMAESAGMHVGDESARQQTSGDAQQEPEEETGGQQQDEDEFA